MGWLSIFLSCLCFGTTNCLWFIIQERTTFLKVIFYRSLVTTSLFASFLFFVPGRTPVFSYYDLIEAFLISIVSCMGLVCYVYSLKFTKVSLAVPISAVNTFFGVLTAVVILKEPFQLNLLLSFFLIAIALLILHYGSKVNLQSTKGISLNFLAAFFWGVTFTLFYVPIQKLGIWAFGLVLEVSVLLVSLLLITLRKEKIKYSDFHRSAILFLLLGLLGFGGVLFFNISTQYLPMSLISILGISTIFISLLISKLWLKETLTLKEWLSAASFITAILLLKLFS